MAGEATDRSFYVERTESRLEAIFSGGPDLENWLRAGAAFGRPLSQVESRLSLLRQMRLISADTFEAMMCAGEAYQPGFVHEMWEALVRARIFVRQFRDTPNSETFADHRIDIRRLIQHLRDGTFRNLFYPPSNLYARYASAVVSVDVTLRSGDQSRGSGFIVGAYDEAKQWLFTCKHNVDPADGVRVDAITSASGEPIKVGPAMLSSAIDLAIFPVRNPIDEPLALRGGGQVFDQVYTLGFPGIPRAQSVLLGHRGEINARTDVVLDRHPALIISNLISPGSSGCPVLNEEGLCLGMSIRWLEGDWGGEKTRFSAALPAEVLITERARLLGE